MQGKNAKLTARLTVEVVQYLSWNEELQNAMSVPPVLPLSGKVYLFVACLLQTGVSNCTRELGSYITSFNTRVYSNIKPRIASSDVRLPSRNNVVIYMEYLHEKASAG